MPRLLRSELLGCAWLVLASGCDAGQQPPAPPDPDKNRECVEGATTPPTEAGVPEGGMEADAGTAILGCSAGEVCVQGRCHERCAGDADCGPREVCGSDGACVPGSAPPPTDAEVRVDAGPGMPCDTVMCDAPQVCHPLSARCVECNEEAVAAAPGSPGRCLSSAPICDIANGRCARFGPAQCSPCNADADCDPGGGFVARCVLREVMGWREQACLQICDSTTPCPSGLGCNGDGACVPPAGASCTTWLAATRRASCSSDQDCNIADSFGSSVFFTQTCEGELDPVPPDGGDGDGGPGDAGPPTLGVCVQPCITTDDCFDVGAGQMCTDTGAGLPFCVP